MQLVENNLSKGQASNTNLLGKFLHVWIKNTYVVLQVLRKIQFAEQSVTKDGKNSMKQFFTVFAELRCL